MSKVYKLSQKKFDALREELAYLRGDREKEVSLLIKQARSFGDLSENSEYDEAKNEQGKLYARIMEIEAIMANYTIISGADFSADTIGIGSIVTVLYTDGETEEFTVVGSQESDPLNARISDESPLGHALVGKKVGDDVCYEAPGGLMTCRIQAIRIARSV